jgi:hypothetical protein
MLRRPSTYHLTPRGEGCSSTASRRPGHADITITLKVYAHLMPNDDEKLAAGAETLYG